ncbi:MAG: Stk1 family PASTA domain-containing Ser/Thr kinase [Actinobacteria bacterium]|nr:Stk1 family PASTA domain-containing Ser/Thr kinase [Actinomycetota bacterium]
MLGKTVLDRYKIVEKIGSGGMADVYLADDILLGRKVAIKTLHAQFAADPTFITRFKREARAAANLHHPNIVDVYDWGNDENCYFLVMEYVKGRMLKEIILQESPLPYEKIIKYSMQICDALNTAHKNDLIHRDIKPQNIIISDDDILKITDFGIAKSLTSTLTQGSAVFGTANYISPEQAEAKSISQTSDIYSLGIVIYEMASGELPFRGDNPISVAMKHIYEVPLQPSYYREDIPYGLEQVILKAINKDPLNRYQNAIELKEALAGCLEVKPPKVLLSKKKNEGARRDDRTRELGKKDRPARFRPLGYLIVIIALLATGSILTFLLWPKEPPIEIVVVPDIKNIDISSAQKKLEEAKLRLSVVEQKYNNEVEPGDIISQNPVEGSKVEKDSTVEVIISKGVETTMMPDLKGLTIGEARNILQQSSINIGKIDSEHSIEVGKDLIIKQSIKAGDIVSKGISVDLTISKGPEMVTVPSVVGMLYEEAKNVITAAKLIPVREDRFNPDTEVGVVISQEPGASSSAQKDSEVILIVSVNNETSIVPDIVGMKADDARARVEGSGFAAVLIKIVSAKDQKNVVLKQEPNAGISLARGSSIRIYIGDGSI